MFKTALIILVVVHGLIHLLGFLKAFDLARIENLTLPVTRTHGVLWLLGSALFLFTAALLLLKVETWWIPLSIGVILSQYLVVTSWHDARMGTVTNVLLAFAAVVGLATWNFAQDYRTAVANGIERTQEESAVSDAELARLPEPVQRYLRYVGVVGKPHVHNFKVVFEAKLKTDPNAAWMDVGAEQYSFTDSPERLFFLTSTMNGLPVAGLHHFRNGQAVMDIRALSLIRAQYADGPEMDRSETVTYLNDLCIMAPAALLDRSIRWIPIDSNCTMAVFTNKGTTISAILYFNDIGELIDFVSEDRSAYISKGVYKRYRWRTPASRYKEFGGKRLASFGEAIFGYPEGDFTYGQFTMRSVEYNVK